MIYYSLGEQNIITDEYQVIRLSEGYCPHKCPWCYEWRKTKEKRVFELPEIVRNDVRITDMNILSVPESIFLLNQFHDKKVNGHVVYPWLVCGLDYRFITDEIAIVLKRNRFQNIHIAWDWYYRDQRKIKNAIKILKKVGIIDVSIFMICNHPAVSYKEACRKLDVCKYWNIKVNDCYFDNQLSPNIIPIAWTIDEIKKFRKSVRKHNQIVNFGCDPEL